MQSSILSHLGTGAVQGSVFFCVVWAVCQLFRRLPAAWRCWLWRLVSFKCLAVMCIAISIPIALHEYRADQVPVTPVRQIAPNSIPKPRTLASKRLPPQKLNSDHNPRILSYVNFLAIWLLGVFLVIARNADAWSRVRSIRQRSTPLTDLPESARAVIARSGFKSPIDIRQSSELTVPALIGFFNPAIVLPSDTGNTSREAQDAALAHEIAHLRRHDIAWIMLVELGKALFWFNPLVWIACREQHAEAEIAADQLARTWTEISPKQYGERLLEWVAPSSDPRLPIQTAPGLMLSTHELSRRMKAMSINRFDRRSSIAIGAMLTLPLGLGLVPITLVTATTVQKAGPVEKVIIPDRGQPRDVLIPANPGSGLFKSGDKILSVEQLDANGTGGPVFEAPTEGGGKIELLGLTHIENGRKISWSADGTRLPELLPSFPFSGPNLFNSYQTDSNGVQHKLKSNAAFTRQALLSYSDPDLHDPSGFFESSREWKSFPSVMSNSVPMPSHSTKGTLLVIQQSFPAEARTAVLNLAYYTKPQDFLSIPVRAGIPLEAGGGFKAIVWPADHFDFSYSHFVHLPKDAAFEGPFAHMDQKKFLEIERPAEFKSLLRVAFYDAGGTRIGEPYDLGSGNDFNVKGEPRGHPSMTKSYWMADPEILNRAARIQLSSTEQRYVFFMGVHLQPNRN